MIKSVDSRVDFVWRDKSPENCSVNQRHSTSLRQKAGGTHWTDLTPGRTVIPQHICLYKNREVGLLHIWLRAPWQFPPPRRARKTRARASTLHRAEERFCVWEVPVARPGCWLPCYRSIFPAGGVIWANQRRVLVCQKRDWLTYRTLSLSRQLSLEQCLSGTSSYVMPMNGTTNALWGSWCDVHKWCPRNVAVVFLEKSNTCFLPKGTVTPPWY